MFLFRCNEKRNCSIQANTSLFSDPCPGTMKYLEAQYHCVPGNSMQINLIFVFIGSFSL